MDPAGGPLGGNERKQVTIDDRSPLTDDGLLASVGPEGARLASPERLTESGDDINSVKGDLDKELLPESAAWSGVR